MSIDEIMRTAFSQPSRVTPEIEDMIRADMLRRVVGPEKRKGHELSPEVRKRMLDTRHAVRDQRYAAILAAFDECDGMTPRQFAERFGYGVTTVRRAIEWRAAQ